MSYQPTQCQAHREPRGHLLNVHPAPLLSSSHPLYLYSSASTATTKHHHPETHCLRALGAGSPGSGCQQGWFLVSSLSLACKCLPSCSVLTWPFLCANTPLVFLPLLIRSPVLSYSNPTIMISGFPGGSVFKKKKKKKKKTVCNSGVIGDISLIPGLGKSPGEGHSNPPQYSCLENPMD